MQKICLSCKGSFEWTMSSHTKQRYLYFLHCLQIKMAGLSLQLKHVTSFNAWATIAASRSWGRQDSHLVNAASRLSNQVCLCCFLISTWHSFIRASQLCNISSKPKKITQGWSFYNSNIQMLTGCNKKKQAVFPYLNCHWYVLSTICKLTSLRTLSKQKHHKKPEQAK